MRVSYIRKIKDQVPLSQQDIKALQHTFMIAIRHKNDGVIEPLLTRGLPLTAPLTNGETALRVAISANCSKIAEMLIVESMRTFQLFPEKDIMDCFRWVLDNQYYHMIDLTIFALKQSALGQKKFAHIVSIIEYFDKLIELYKKNEVQSFHLKEFSDLLNKCSFDKPLYFYLYYKWDAELSTKYTGSIDCYQLLANSYYERDKAHKLMILQYNQSKSIALLFMSLGLVSAPLLLASLMHTYYLSIFIGIIGIIFAGVTVLSFKKLFSLKKDITSAIQDRLLLKACREGNYGLTAELLQKGAHVNILAGIAESTPLYEATLCNHASLRDLLAQFNAYSGRKSQTILFP
ncbi:MAG: ankyrin repeat domain-containing protein [Gammaproteobacteria bacterium]|nr:ankyrin repeat domain-containing protein [Gammaproteobacteria bacterium]